MFANTRISLSVIAALDVCKFPSPAGARPFTNAGDCAQAETESTKVSIEGLPTFRVSDQIPMSAGDEVSKPYGGGVIGYVPPTAKKAAVPGPVKGPVNLSVGSQKVFFEGQPPTRQTDPSTSNQSNASSTMPAPAQQKLQIFS